MAVAAFVRWASSGVHRSRPQRTTRPASNTGEPAVSDSTVSFSFLRHIAASAREGDSGVSCEGGAAIAGARCTSFAEDQIHIMGFATLFDQVCLPGVGCDGTQVSHAACSHTCDRGPPGRGAP